jgi:hypothetical protein
MVWYLPLFLVCLAQISESDAAASFVPSSKPSARLDASRWRLEQSDSSMPSQGFGVYSDVTTRPTFADANVFQEKEAQAERLGKHLTDSIDLHSGCSSVTQSVLSFYRQCRHV